MVGYDDEGGGRGPLPRDPRELLGEGLARQARERRVVVDQRGADGSHGRGLVDEGDADDVLGLGNCLGRRHVRPRSRAHVLVECLDEAREGRVAVRPHAHGDRVLNLFEGNHIGTQRIDRGNNLRLLVRKGLTRERAAHLALLGRHEGTRTVRVTRATGLVNSQVGKVVEHVERSYSRVPTNRGRARALPGDGHGRTIGVPSDHGGRLEDE